MCGECLVCECVCVERRSDLSVCIGDIESTDKYIGGYIGGWNPPPPQADTHTLFRYTYTIQIHIH